MAWASTDIVPANLNLNVIFSISAALFEPTVTTKISPKSSSNTIFDFTAATALAANTVNNPSLVSGLQLQSSAVPTMVAHDATGLTFSITGSEAGSLLGNLGTLSAPYTLYATDGTTQLLVAKGTMNIQVTP